MICTTNPTDTLHQKSFRIKHEDDKFFTRLLSKESSKSNPSFGVYYGNVPSAVPFTWETRPGTPKQSFSDNLDVPPLTPPPSYFTDKSLKNSKRSSRSNLLHTLLRRIMNPNNNKRIYQSYSPSMASSVSSSSSSVSSFSGLTRKFGHRRGTSCFSSFEGSSIFHEKAMDFDISPTCFGDRNENGERRYSVLFMKKAFLSIVGRGSS